jgi:hypothetical protein
MLIDLGTWNPGSCLADLPRAALRDAEHLARRHDGRASQHGISRIFTVDGARQLRDFLNRAIP